MTRTSGNNLPNLPYKDHPLYKLRRLALIAVLAGFLLNLFVIGVLVDNNSYDIPPFVIAIVILLISFIVVLHDLISYTSALFRLQNSLPVSIGHASSSASHKTEQKPNWPAKRLIITDFILALIFQWLFWTVLSVIVGSYRRYSYHGGTEMIEAYANLVNLLVSILHGIAFWKELVARKEQAWRKTYEAENQACENCGYSKQVAGAITTIGTAKARKADNDVWAGAKKKQSGRPKGKDTVIMPKWARAPDAGHYTGDNVIEYAGSETNAEEPLLVTPEHSTTGVAEPSSAGASTEYGTISQSVDSVRSAPETVVKKKDKGKKRLVEVD